MLGFLAPLLGGIGGLLFPAAGAAAAGGAAATGIGALLSKAALPALGAGLGTLVTGGSGKDAIRNALFMGAGVTAFPGLAGKIQGSEFGQSITSGLADIFGGGTQQAPMTSPMPQRRPEPGSATMSTSERAPDDGMGMTGMEDEARRRMTTIPTLSEINAVRPEFPAMGFPEQMGYARPEFPAMGFPPMQDLGMEDEARDRGGYAIMPPTGLVSRNMDMDRALDMAREAYAVGDFRRADDLLNVYNRRFRGRGFAMGGEIEGPGTGTSDSVPAEIYQDGKPVQKAALSDGEFVMTADAVRGAGNGSRDRGVKRMYELMRRFESGEMA
jgi:hypothetical protein